MKRSVEKKLRRAVERVRGRRSEPNRVPTVEAIETWLTERIAHELGVERSAIRTDVPFERYGLDSRIVAAIAGDLEDWLQRPLEPTLLWDYPTIHEVSGQLEARKRRRGAAGSRGS